MSYQKVINIAVIAHVDAGKSTLVDAFLRQSHVFRDNEDVVDCVMDSNELERERGITIYSKNCSVMYKDIKVNIENGVAKLIYLFDNFDNNNVTASFAGEGYVSNSTTTTCNVNYANLTASDVEVYFLSIISFSAKLTDRYGNAVADKEIIFTVNNKTYSVKTNSKGIATINPYLDLGSHTVVMGFNDTLGKCFNNLTKTINVNARCGIAYGRV